ncbi:MAG: hypothetical protein M0P57_02730 [Syntrophales bacterium]|nr:hypothetical protein [Syntrophales bacterium]
MLCVVGRKKCGDGSLKRAAVFLAVFIVCVTGSSGGFGLKQAAAETSAPGDWYRLRTNSVPYQPLNVFYDSESGLWVTAIEGTEYDPGVWYRAPGDPVGKFRYITNSRRNNAVGETYLTVVEKPELITPVRCALKDGQGNTWYALTNRQVLCERPEGTKLTFTMQDTSDPIYGVDTSNVDSVHRIRLIDKGSGTQDVLLISARGIIRIDTSLSVVETREVYYSYNNYFISDALIDSRGRYWVADGYGVATGASLVNTSYVYNQMPDDPDVPGANPISYIEEDANGNIWVGSGSYVAYGVYCYTAAGAWVKYDLKTLLNVPDSRINAVEAAADGSVWFGGGYSQNGGLIRFVPGEGGGQWTRYRAADLGLNSEQIPGIEATAEGIWFTTGWDPSTPGNGTGVHYLPVDAQGQPQVAQIVHHTFRESSTTLTSNRIDFIAADKIGGVWFPAYDDPSIARLKSDGTWEQYRGTVGGKSLGSFGIHGVAVDSENRIYFAPLHQSPVAYDAAAGQWMDLPSASFNDYFYYGIYVDPEDGKWFYGAFGAYYLDPSNSTWMWYDSSDTEYFPDYRVDGVRMDDAGNVWFMTWGGIALMKKDIAGGLPQWLQFVSGDASGYLSGYRIYQDDEGGIWNSARQKYVPSSNTWTAVTDTSAFDHRHLRFTNGNVPADMDLTGAIAPVAALDETHMTVDRRGVIYFSGGLGGGVNTGIAAFAPPRGDADGNLRVELNDALYILMGTAGVSPGPPSPAGDANGDGKLGTADVIYILQRIAGLR